MWQLMFFLTLSFSFVDSDEPVKVKSPNIIVIMADDLGYNDLGCYRKSNLQLSNKPPTSHTPNIDLLSAQGMLFTDFYCGAAVCSPSRAAMLTGRNATRTGVYNWIPSNSPMHLATQEATIAEMLKTNKYQTGHFGKWHLTSEGTNQPKPNDQGFDYSFYTFKNAEPSHKNPVNFLKNDKPIGETEGYACDLVVNEAIGWLEDIKNREAPFYMNVWFNEPHMQVAAPDELVRRHSYNKEYYGAIENMDLAVGKLMKYLKEKKLEENTIVIFTSDNGSRWENSNDPLLGLKCFNYEGGVRVPFIIKWPHQFSQGIINNQVGSFTDLLPTIAEITDTDLPKGRKLDGISLVKTIKSGGKTIELREKPVFFFRYFHDPILMLREGNWCLLGYRNQIPTELRDNLNEEKLANLEPWEFQSNHMEYIKSLKPIHFELYNLENDIVQRKNLASQFPDVVAGMKKRMLVLQDEMLKEGNDWYND